MSEQLYYKKGRRYVKANDPYAMDGLSDGVWCVHVRKNGAAMRRLVEPDVTSVMAALVIFKEVLVNKLREASKLRPITIKMSRKEQKAWDNYKKEMGKDIPTMFGYDFLYDIAENAIGEFEKSTIKSKNTYNNEKS